MNHCTDSILRVLVLSAVGTSLSSAAGVFVAGVDGSMSVGGTTTTIEGNNFDAAGSATRWTNPGTSGSDFVGETGWDGTGTAPNNLTDWYVQILGANLTAFNLTVADNRYVEIFYSTNAAFTAAGASDIDDNRFFLSTTNQAANQGNNLNDSSLPPVGPGSHSFVLDLLSSDGTTLDTSFLGTETWDQFRWDMWNGTASPTNEGITFTLDKVVFGNQLVPEPSSSLLFCLGAFGLIARRRR